MEAGVDSGSEVVARADSGVLAGGGRAERGAFSPRADRAGGVRAAERRRGPDAGSLRSRRSTTARRELNASTVRADRGGPVGRRPRLRSMNRVTYSQAERSHARHVIASKLAGHDTLGAVLQEGVADCSAVPDPAPSSPRMELGAADVTAPAPRRIVSNPRSKSSAMSASRASKSAVPLRCARTGHSRCGTRGWALSGDDADSTKMTPAGIEPAFRRFRPASTSAYNSSQPAMDKGLSRNCPIDEPLHRFARMDEE